MLLYLTLAGYIIFLFFVAFVGGRHEAHQPTTYAMAGRQVGSFGVFASVFTLIGAGEFLTVAALAFVNDGAAVLLLTGYGIGMVILGSFASIARKQSEGKFYISLPDLIYDRFGAAAGLLSQVLTLLAFFALLTLQLFAGAVVLSAITPLPFLGGIIGCAVIVVGYLWQAGFRGVVATDIAQFALMAIGLPLLALLALPAVDDVSALTQLDFSPVGTISVLLTGIFVVIGSGDIWQRLYAAKNADSARRGLLLAGIGFVIYSVVLTLIGIAARIRGLTDDPDQAFLAVVLTSEPAWLPIVVVLAVFSAILSTADTETYLLASLLANEKRRWTGSSTSRELHRSAIQPWLPVVAVIASVAAYFASQLVAIYEFLLMALLALAPLVLLAPFRKLSARSATLVLFSGLVAFIALRVLAGGLDFAVLAVIPGLLVGATFILSKRATQA